MTIRPQTTLWLCQDGTRKPICDMSTDHIIRAINWQVAKRGHKHTKLHKLVTEFYRRTGEKQLDKIPYEHKWIKPVLNALRTAPATSTKQMMDAMLDLAFGTIDSIPANAETQECPRCFGTMVSKGNSHKELWECLNCGYHHIP